jgi:hypothetical protein
MAVPSELSHAVTFQATGFASAGCWLTLFQCAADVHNPPSCGPTTRRASKLQNNDAHAQDGQGAARYDRSTLVWLAPSHDGAAGAAAKEQGRAGVTTGRPADEDYEGDTYDPSSEDVSARPKRWWNRGALPTAGIRR